MISLLQAGSWFKLNPFCFRRIQLQSPGSAPFMFWFDTILEFHHGIWNVRSRCILDKLSVVCIHVMVQKMVVDKVCQIFGDGIEFLRSQYLIPIPVAHCSRLCEGAIVDLWPGRFVVNHWEDMTRTTSEPYFSHRIDRAAPVTWLDDLHCRKHVVQYSAIQHKTT